MQARNSMARRRVARLAGCARQAGDRLRQRPLVAAGEPAQLGDGGLVVEGVGDVPHGQRHQLVDQDHHQPYRPGGQLVSP
jgi:hypothetical protein